MTPDPLEREPFARLVRALGYPPVAGVAAGEAAWRDVLARAGRADRRVWLPQLERALLGATPQGARRLAAHEHRRGELGPELDHETARAIVNDALLYYGDRNIRPIVVDAIASLPAYARDATLETSAWLGVGIDAAAWTQAARLVDSEGHTRAGLVVCSARTTLHVVRHEAAHLWHAPDSPPEHQQAITAAGEDALIEHARETGWLDQVHEHDDTSELLAESLALVWGRRADEHSL